MMRVAKAALVLAICMSAGMLATASAQTLLMLNSQPGDSVGQGLTQTFTPADGAFTVQTVYNGGIEVFFQGGGHYWTLFFGPPSTLSLTNGVYEGAQRFAFHAPPKPGLDVSGDSRGCNTLTGRFSVSDVAIVNGIVERLAVDFEQHCEGLAPALFGSVRFNSAVTVEPRASVADAIALKGNAGTDDAGMMISLSMPSTQPVTVKYATADGTATRKDYSSTSGTVQFPAGVTAQSITVPIVGNRLAGGNKSFQVLLSASVGASLGDSTSNMIILDPNVPQSVLAMDSQFGDYIGAGQYYLVTIGDGVFTASRNFDNGVNMSLQSWDRWELDFAGPDNATLVPGIYENAQRFPFQATGTPGLSVFGAGRGCNTLTGRFVINQASYASDSSVQDFAADFEQHCEGGIPALFGWIRLNSILRQLSVTNAKIGKSSAVFTVTLNPASTDVVSVNFGTADGTAVAGLDYAATYQTLTFTPGQVQRTVSVPLLGSNRKAPKAFFGRISSPRGAAMWNAQGRATF